MITTLEGVLSTLLWLAGVGHFCLLGASVQVPHRLKWREDLAQLSPFNRKLMWTYAAFTVLIILAFGTLTLLLHEELLRGERAALALAGLMGFFWTARLVVDFTYFSHTDWPQGRWFLAGHVLLSSLLAALAGTYLLLVSWHVCKTLQCL